MTTAVSDEELAGRTGEGDQEAFGELYRRYFPGAFDFAARIVHDPDRAGDVVQTAFVRVYESLGSGTRPRSFKAYLYGIARNGAIDEIRRGRRVVSSGNEQGSDWVELTVADSSRFADPEAVAQANEVAALVWEVASGLGPDEYSLLDLHVRRGLSNEELAETLGIRTGNVYTRLSRLRDAVEDALTAELLSRRGRGDCATLDALLDELGASGVTPETRRAVKRHVESCDVCATNKRRFVSASAILAAFVITPAPAGTHDDVWGRINEQTAAGPRGQGSAGGTSSSYGKALLRAITAAPARLAALGAGAVALLAAIVAFFVLSSPATPTDPSGFHSASHRVGEVSAQRIVTVEWDRHDSAAAYAVSWSRDANELPPARDDLAGDATSARSPNLEAGDWYFNLRTRNSDGRWTSTVHLGPFKIGAVQIVPSRPLIPSAAPARTTPAIRVGSLFLPLDQLHRAPPDACTGEHWHPSGPAVRAISGETVRDPAPNGCGFGRTADVPLVDAPLP
jgi:RNA polymerase sigma factor (sigma-70 family)